jgi:hypothetical protein
MSKTIMWILFMVLSLSLASCDEGGKYHPGDGEEDGQPDTADQPDDTQADEADAPPDVPPDGDVVTDDAADAPDDGTGDDGETPSCPPGTGDCDGDPANGCETDTTTSAAHCGACNHGCLGGTCQASACQPVKVADPQGSPGPGVGNGFLAQDATTIYFGYKGTTVGGVAMAAKDGSGASCIACDTGEPRWLAADSVSVYWADIGLDEVRKAPLGGGAVTTLVTIGNLGTPIAVDSSHVYYVDEGASSVMQADLDGSNQATVEGGQTHVNSLAADGGFLFWATQTQVMAEDLSGSGPATALAGGRTDPRHVAADATHVYWAEGPWGGAETVQRILRSGGAPEQIAAEGAFAIALDATHVYATDNHDGQVWRVPKDGGTVEILAAGLTYPFDIVVDDVAVYWASETTAEVQKVAK